VAPEADREIVEMVATIAPSLRVFLPVVKRFSRRLRQVLSFRGRAPRWRRPAVAGRAHVRRSTSSTYPRGLRQPLPGEGRADVGVGVSPFYPRWEAARHRAPGGFALLAAGRRVRKREGAAPSAVALLAQRQSAPK
jgi:hypothetical protein